jgi:hypothetical protein
MAEQGRPQSADYSNKPEPVVSTTTPTAPKAPVAPVVKPSPKTVTAPEQHIAAIKDHTNSVGSIALQLQNSNELADFLFKLSQASIALTALEQAEAQRAQDALAAAAEQKDVENM